MRRRDLSRAIFAAAAAPALGAPRPVAEVAPSDSPTRAEREAGVTPADTRYAPGNVRRYGARGDGRSNDAPAFQAAINVARRPNPGTVYAPGGAAETVWIPAPEMFYLLTSPLDCTFTGSANQHGITIRGECAPSPDSPAIIARHQGHVFDLTGCNSAVFENLNIGTDAQTNPQTCFFLARNRTRGSAGFHRFRNVRVHGKFTAAILYNYGSEGNVCSECVWFNESSAPRTKVAVFSSHNIFGLSSQFTATASGSQSCIDHQIFGGELCNTSAEPEADVLYLDAVDSLKIFAPWMAAGLYAPGRALIYIDSRNGASSLAEVYGLQGEGGATQRYGFYFDDHSVNAASGWTIHGCLVPNATQALYCAPNTTLDHFHISNLRERAAHGLLARGVVQNSSIDSGALPLAIGTSRRNTLIGDSSYWKIGKREHDYWIDSGSARKSWSPGTQGLSIRGPLRIESATCIFHGPLVTLSTTLSAESIECASGTALTGLPAAATTQSAGVNVCDGASGMAVGAGMVSGSTIILPAISPRRSIVISASYFAA
ncbi:MAG: hypothetical protein JO299_16165 [Gammaproteobacteria bacterium]|nr:hypothetical protein [Gammaproteobacteria bacterium]